MNMKGMNVPSNTHGLSDHLSIHAVSPFVLSKRPCQNQPGRKQPSGPKDSPVVHWAIEGPSEARKASSLQWKLREWSMCLGEESGSSMIFIF